MKKIKISKDFEEFEFEGLYFWFHVDAEIHVDEPDENNQSESRLYYADISNGAYAESMEAAEEGKYSDMTPEQRKKIERSLDVEHFRF